MEAIISIIVQLVAGGVGGYATGQAAKSVSLGNTANTAVGAVGGLVLTWLAQQVPGIAGLIPVGTDVGAIVAQGVGGLVGGGVVTAVVGAIKNAMAKA